MLSVPVVQGVCFLSGLKNFALKCLCSADYFSVFLCHTNSSALVGRTALVLSAETCFCNQHGSCVVLAGVRGGKVWGGRGGKPRRALARRALAQRACHGRRWGERWCSGVGQWWVGALGLCPPPRAAQSLPQPASAFLAHPELLPSQITPRVQRASSPRGGDGLWSGVCHSRDREGKLR